MPDPDQLPLGDIGFYDNDVPGIAAGNYWISVSHELADNGATINTEPLGAAQEFVVSAPQFMLQPAEIVSQRSARHDQRTLWRAAAARRPARACLLPRSAAWRTRRIPGSRCSSSPRTS